MDNPYAPPQSVITPVPSQNTNAEITRKAHLSNEASIKSIGTLYYLAAILLSIALAVSSVGIAPLLLTGEMGAGELALTLGSGLLFIGIVVFCWKLAGGLRKLRPWVRIPIIILSVIGLVDFPIGTLISGYILVLMLSPKSKMVFTPEYQQIIADTPHLRYRSGYVKIALTIILIMAVLMAVAMTYRL